MGIINIPELGAILERDMIASMASRMEYLGINGNGTAPQPTGILNASGLGAVVGGANGAQINWGHLVDLEAACALLNAEPTLQGGYIVNSKSRQWMKKNVRGTYLPFIWGGASPEFPLNDRRAGVTTNCPSTGTKGTSVGVCSSIIYGADWSQLVVGLLGALDIVVDPASGADKGEVRINMTQLFDVQIRQPAGFALMTDALTA
jgi:HK97 family phage major capsid protein